MRELGKQFVQPSLWLHSDFAHFLRPAQSSCGSNAIFFTHQDLPVNRTIYPLTLFLSNLRSDFRMRLRAMPKSRMRLLRLLRKLSNIISAASTRAFLDGKIPQEIHPSMVNNRKRREIVQSVRTASFPDGIGMKGNRNP
jgi:hypothetical protein